MFCRTYRFYPDIRLYKVSAYLLGNMSKERHIIMDLLLAEPSRNHGRQYTRFPGTQNVLTYDATYSFLQWFRFLNPQINRILKLPQQTLCFRALEHLRNFISDGSATIITCDRKYARQSHFFTWFAKETADETHKEPTNNYFYTNSPMVNFIIFEVER